MKVFEKVIPTPTETYKPSNPFLGKVMENTRLTPPTSQDDIRHIVIDLCNSGINYVEGQSIGIIPPGTKEDGSPHKVRLYSISSARTGDDGKKSTVSLTVKRVVYLDENGQEQRGVASNYICDTKPGEEVKITGPAGRKMLLPQDDTVNLLMIAVGTGIAPFRGFLQHIYQERGHWNGCVRLFYGAKTGMESLYMNDENNDIGQYMTQDTFKAIKALSREEGEKKTYVQDQIALCKERIWPVIKEGHFSLYICGLKGLEAGVEAVLDGWAQEEGLDWNEMRDGYKKEGRWNIEVY